MIDEQTMTVIKSLANHSYGGRFAVFMCADDARAILASMNASFSAEAKPMDCGTCGAVGTMTTTKARCTLCGMFATPSQSIADTAGAKLDLQAFAEKVRDGIADYVADNMPDRKHSLSEIDLYVRKIEINAAMIASPAIDAAGASSGERAYVIAALVAAGHVSRSKVDEAFALARKHAPRPAAQDDLTAAVERTIETLNRQIDLIAERAPGQYLDKMPVVRSLHAHARRLTAAIAKETQDGPAQ